MTTLAIVDAEATAKAWALANPDIIAAVGDRVFYATPQPYDKAPPQSWLTLALVSEVHEAGDLGLQSALIQFDARGRTKLLAATAALAVQTAARKLSFGPRVTVGQSVIEVADVSQKRWLPDPTTNTPRYSIDVLFTLRGSEQ